MRHQTICRFGTALFAAVIVCSLFVRDANTASAQGVVAGARVAPRDTMTSIVWMTQLPDAHETARATGKLVLLHFYGDHCAPCKRMDAEVFPNRNVINAIARDYIPVKINSNLAPDLVGQFGVRGIPADIVLVPDGRVIHKREGGITPDRYVDYLAAVAERVRQLQIPTPQIPLVPPQATVAFDSPSFSFSNAPSPSPWGDPVAVAIMPTSVEHGATLVTTPIDVSSPPMIELPLALDGFCPVTLQQDEKWGTGNPLFYDLYRGQIYRFADEIALELFRAAPERYAPVAEGNDIVVFVERQRTVAGLRRLGVWYAERTFLFASRESLEAFAKRPEFFAELADRYEATREPVRR